MRRSPGRTPREVEDGLRPVDDSKAINKPTTKQIPHTLMLKLASASRLVLKLLAQLIQQLLQAGVGCGDHSAMRVIHCASGSCLAVGRQGYGWSGIGSRAAAIAVLTGIDECEQIDARRQL